MEIQTYIFMDLETTGIPKNDPVRTRITELCLIAVRKIDILNSKKIRIHDTFSICVNPNRSVTIGATEVSGEYSTSCRIGQSKNANPVCR